jgi:hypothetical protein
MFTLSLTPDAAAFIAECEGRDQPSKWPGLESGITLGHGFDLGYCSSAEFTEAWQRHLSAAHFELLRSALGWHGNAARQIASRFAGILIKPPAALEVFTRCTLPQWCQRAAGAMPGIHALPPHTAGAVVSMIFNRGPAMGGPRQKEKRCIRDAVARHAATSGRQKRETVTYIAAQLRDMKRLWPNTPGLQNRREKEAVFALLDLA